MYQSQRASSPSGNRQSGNSRGFTSRRSDSVSDRGSQRSSEGASFGDRPRSYGGARSSSSGGSRGFGGGSRSFSGGRSSFGGGQRSSGGGRSAMRARRSFDPSRFVSQATTPVVSTQYEPENTFLSFSLHSQLQKNIDERGYTQVTPIQDKVIPVVLSGRDVVGLANTGTGKTAAFLVPLIQKLSADSTQKILIVAPTRELAVQIEQECQLFAKGMSINTALCIGGMNINTQVQKLRRTPRVVIGTPGRLKDLENQRALNLKFFQNIVLDEVDQMLNMGFIRDIRHLVALLPQERHSLFFSATMTSDIERVMRDFLNNPVQISVKTAPTTSNIDQNIIRTNGRIKIEVLQEMLMQDEFKKVLIFLRTKRATERLSQNLDDLGISAAAVHGNKSQYQRQKAIDQFKSNRVKVLLATDVASRGLDIDDVSHVINFDLPETLEDYIHRIGRTGRADKKGVALTFVE